MVPPALVVLLAGCGTGAALQGGASPAPGASRTGLLQPAPAGSPIPGPTSSPTHVATRSPASPDRPVFHGAIHAIDAATRARMKSSWHPGCPVPISSLRLLTLSYWGFDGRIHAGEMVVNQKVAGDVVAVFHKLFDARFPIRRMNLVDAYGGDDDASMAADNTSAFNCRAVTGGSAWSEHAFGRAIDINPIENPYVTAGGTVEPPAGRAFADRSLRARGMIHPGDAVVRAFASIGWVWGGTWRNPRDYQHFSSTGR